MRLERVMVTHDQKGSPFFVDITGKKYHIERLDLSEALPPAIPMMGESEQIESSLSAIAAVVEKLNNGDE